MKKLIILSLIIEITTMNTDPELCKALTSTGNPCTSKGKEQYEGLCKMHFNQLERQRERLRSENEAREQAEAAAEKRRIENRNRILQSNKQRIDAVATGSIDLIYRYARLIADLWVTQRVEDDLLAQAYCAIRKVSIADNGWLNLVRCAVTVINLAYFHPDGLRWQNIPETEKTAAFNTLRDAMTPYQRYDILEALRSSDIVHIEFQRRREEERIAVERAREREAALERERQRTTVFRRDPEGGIDLAAFSRDSQAVHRSSVQEATQKAVNNLAARTVPLEMEALVEITQAFDDRKAITIGSHRKERTLLELTNDYYNTEAFGHPYGYILERVWTYIRTHAERTELVRRLFQEVYEGINMCANGKMAHLVNILYAYDDEITALMQNEKPSREAFQAKFSTLLAIPAAERKSAAETIFNDYHIPDEEREQWLTPMLEAE